MTRALKVGICLQMGDHTDYLSSLVFFQGHQPYLYVKFRNNSTNYTFGTGTLTYLFQTTQTTLSHNTLQHTFPIFFDRDPSLVISCPIFLTDIAR